MPLIEAALAFAITMLALSLIVSSLVELIHRAFKMREAGLQYMLEQLFDQALVKYAKPADTKIQELTNDPRHQGKPAAEITQLAYEELRDSFVERMTANRAPVGLKPDPTLAAVPKPAAGKPWWWPAALGSPEDAKPSWWPTAWGWPGNTKPGLRLGNIWGGRRVSELTPTDFMERLGSDAVGDTIANAAITAERVPADAVDVVLKSVGQKLAGTNVSDEINKKIAAGQSPADAAVAVLKDIAQKPGGSDIGEELKMAATATGQVAADTLDTVLKDIAQKFDGFGKDAATYFEGRARFMSVMVAIVLAFVVHVDAVDLFTTYLRDPNARAKVIEQSQAVTAQYKAAQEAADAVKKLAPNDPEASPVSPDVKAQIKQLQKDWDDASKTVKQYADLGVPLGWTPERLTAADMKLLVWTCKELLAGEKKRYWTLRQKCRPDDPGYKGVAGQQYKSVYLQVPRNPRIVFYLLLGGLMIGLGSPFWYDAVTRFTSLRNAAKGAGGAAAPAQAAAVAAARVTATDADKAQPVTPVGAFQVSNAARKP
jgi:hypothetical protein